MEAGAGGRGGSGVLEELGDIEELKGNKTLEYLDELCTCGHPMGDHIVPLRCNDFQVFCAVGGCKCREFVGRPK